MSAVVMGISIVRVHSDLNFASDPFAGAREVTRKILRGNPSVRTTEVIARVLVQMGESISAGSVPRLRHRLKQEDLQEQ